MTPSLLLLACLAAPVADVTAYNDTKPGIMASGRRVYDGACAGPRSVPLGTLVRIGGKVYTVEDRTARRLDGRWDIWRPWSKVACMKWGKRTMTVTILSGKGRR